MSVLNFEPATVDIAAREDTTLSFPIDFKDEVGAALDVSGRTFEAAIAALQSDTALVTASVDYTDAATGTIVIDMNLAVLDPGPYVWDLWETTGAVLLPILGGAVTVSRRVTGA